jgi:hypothetical protein
VERYRASMSESDMLTLLRDYVEAEGGVFWHIRDARGQEVVGVPDVICILPPRRGVAPGIVAFFELKTQKDRVTVQQLNVLRLADMATEVVAGIVRPNPRSQFLEITIDDALELLGRVPWS